MKLGNDGHYHLCKSRWYIFCPTITHQRTLCKLPSFSFLFIIISFKTFQKPCISFWLLIPDKCLALQFFSLSRIELLTHNPFLPIIIKHVHAFMFFHNNYIKLIILKNFNHGTKYFHSFLLRGPSSVPFTFMSLSMTEYNGQKIKRMEWALVREMYGIVVNFLNYKL